MGKGKWKGKTIMKQRLVPWDKKREKINGVPQHMTKRQRGKECRVRLKLMKRDGRYNLQLPGRASLGGAFKRSVQTERKLKIKLAFCLPQNNH